MAVTEQEFDQAEKRMTELRAAGHAVSARYDRRRDRYNARDSGKFTCYIERGRVADVDYSGIRGLR